ncbi:MAG TPA: methylenetetrahydrofolate--tRNA-(uracil(54)-C(5))-methyltransferase (FADH(2)-oxidizing) TrmFO [Candidatus Butyricicoccus avistercoris]|uniref:Methylenetetrahydrofolate--tRNA-(uracil-5-)-methyltransferase TrmFO n=1 Tax=Candidatus Butyricicoccus avistercoris TaxID=2838518 RepID=A0A9D1PH56_9FIRM|nr:methylenetetrahydrofolate--tRNA-(uracil(54)-C(5))-methyltransferase (FADH(2)-oxidizing) TrmFO [Candidatus Butyricicoccus avistercoris]
MQNNVSVIGAGLAGCEAAWQLAERGINVTLYEMKPEKKTPAHHSDDFAELVCSNSLRSNELTNAAGLLKEELRRLGGLIVKCADENQVEAGGALAVDREAFAKAVTDKIKNHPNIKIVYGEVTEIPKDGHVIIATGPLTSDALFDAIHEKVGGDFLHFFDAAAPIVTFESIDMDRAYFASRYDKGTPDYINCPLSKEEFDPFWEALTTAEEAEVHGFEDKLVFEGCMPIEVNARRGHDTLLFGILKPVGLPDPKTGKDPYAVLQLRKDNAQGSLYNLVGCQTHLKWGEQKRIFSMIPALKNAEYVRYGVMHRNTFLDSPRLLDRNFALRSDSRIRFAGQMTGVEGYVESNASGFLAGLATANEILGKKEPNFPQTTAIGALGHYISNETVVKFQPMNINFGILEPLGYKIRGKREKNMKISERALEIIDNMKGDI